MVRGLSLTIFVDERSANPITVAVSNVCHLVNSNVLIHEYGRVVKHRLLIRCVLWHGKKNEQKYQILDISLLIIGKIVIYDVQSVRRLRIGGAILICVRNQEIGLPFQSDAVSFSHQRDAVINTSPNRKASLKVYYFGAGFF